MKVLLLKLNILLFLLFFSSISYAIEKIVYVDMNFLINSSKAGISINKQMENLIKKNNQEYEKIEKKLLKEEEDILKKKNVLDPQKFNEEVSNFRDKIKKFRTERGNQIENIKTKNINAKNELVKIVTKILAEYSAKNEISLVLNKEGIILGKKDIDISERILETLNKEVKNIKLK
tara:strand:- start:13 stop:540 length:528 start_codon:yes stop_codon:yes gene_type:complete